MDGRAYLYRPVASREEVTARALRDLLDSCEDAEAVLLRFVRSVSERESEVRRDALAAAENPPPPDVDPGSRTTGREPVAVTLLLGAAIVALTAPHLLLATAERAVDPVTVIVGWYLAIVGVLATTVAGLLLMTFLQGAVDTPLAHLVRRPWWYAVRRTCRSTGSRAGWPRCCWRS